MSNRAVKEDTFPTYSHTADATLVQLVTAARTSSTQVAELLQAQAERLQQLESDALGLGAGLAVARERAAIASAFLKPRERESVPGRKAMELSKNATPIGARQPTRVTLDAWLKQPPTWEKVEDIPTGRWVNLRPEVLKGLKQDDDANNVVEDELIMDKIGRTQPMTTSTKRTLEEHNNITEQMPSKRVAPPRSAIIRSRTEESEPTDELPSPPPDSPPPPLPPQTGKPVVPTRGDVAFIDGQIKPRGSSVEEEDPDGSETLPPPPPRQTIKPPPPPQRRRGSSGDKDDANVSTIPLPIAPDQSSRKSTPPTTTTREGTSSHQSGSLASRQAMLTAMMGGSSGGKSSHSTGTAPSVSPNPSSPAVGEINKASKSALEEKLMGSSGNTANMAKYEKMLRAGLPRAAVEHAMRKDGVDTKLLGDGNDGDSDNKTQQDPIPKPSIPQPSVIAPVIAPPRKPKAIPPPLPGAKISVGVPPSSSSSQTSSEPSGNKPHGGGLAARQAMLTAMMGGGNAGNTPTSTPSPLLPTSATPKPPPPKEISSASKAALEQKLLTTPQVVDMSKFERMKKAGLPRGAVEHAARKDGLSEAQIAKLFAGE